MAAYHCVIGDTFGPFVLGAHLHASRTFHCPRHLSHWCPNARSDVSSDQDGCLTLSQIRPLSVCMRGFVRCWCQRWDRRICFLCFVLFSSGLTQAEVVNFFLLIAFRCPILHFFFILLVNILGGGCTRGWAASA